MAANTYDYVIAGAGSAGCVLAARLSANPALRVALVEAGPADTHPDIRIPMSALRLLGSECDWAYVTVGQPNLAGRHIYWPRGRTLGGSSSINFQMWIPGHRLDYDCWAEITDESWSWEAVNPYFRRAERWAGEPADGATFGTDGPLWISPPRDPDPTTRWFVEACGELGLKEVSGGLGGPDNTGCGVTPLNQFRGARWSAADGYLRTALERTNLTVLTDQVVHRILFDGLDAVGVESTGGRLTARREVILSAGAIGSPQVLMLSGIGDSAELRRVGIVPLAHVPGVGENLHDHIAADVSRHAKTHVRLVGAHTEENLRAFNEDRCGPLTSNLAEAVAFVRSEDGCPAPDLELIWAPIAFTDDGADTPGLTVSVVLLQPESRGNIRLVDADPTTPPQIDPRYLTAEADLRTLTAGIRFTERLFNTAALQQIVAGGMEPWLTGMSDDALVETLRERAGTLFHPVGTCRMGRPGDGGAVVDPSLRVRGVRKLRVADASVIPRIPRGHTHAAAVMIGERAADIILAGT